MSDELKSFVAQALGRGFGKPAIEEKLLEAGWPHDEIKGELAAFADVEFAVPVPRPRPYLSARDAFVYLVLFLTLYTSAIALIGLLFALIAHVLPDAGIERWRSTGPIRWYCSSLLIAFPIYFWLSRKTYRSVRENPDKRQSKVRKWLSYLTLFVAAGVLLCDCITLVYHFLGGELTARFVLKVFVVATVSGAVFGFYLWHLRQDDVDPALLPPSHRGIRVLAGAAIAVVGASILWGLIVAGSPQTARAQVLDQQRVNDLSLIASAVDAHWQRVGSLPPGLEELSRQREVYLASIVDPATGQAYEYRPAKGKSYTLCAVFSGGSPEAPQRPYRVNERFWEHDAGRTCFELEVLATR